jgi:hypothetical protein
MEKDLGDTEKLLEIYKEDLIKARENLMTFKIKTEMEHRKGYGLYCAIKDDLCGR